MQIRLNGDIATIVAGINFNDLKELTSSGQAIKLVDENGKCCYGVTTGTRASLNEAGACFTFGTADNKAAMNIGLPSGLDDSKKFIVDTYGAAIDILNTNEDLIIEAIESIKNTRTEISNMIEQQ